jgi:hypothetical protein
LEIAERKNCIFLILKIQVFFLTKICGKHLTVPHMPHITSGTLDWKNRPLEIAMKKSDFREGMEALIFVIIANVIVWPIFIPFAILVGFPEHSDSSHSPNFVDFLRMVFAGVGGAMIIADFIALVISCLCGICFCSRRAAERIENLVEKYELIHKEDKENDKDE